MKPGEFFKSLTVLLVAITFASAAHGADLRAQMSSKDDICKKRKASFEKGFSYRKSDGRVTYNSPPKSLQADYEAHAKVLHEIDQRARKAPTQEILKEIQDEYKAAQKRFAEKREKAGYIQRTCMPYACTKKSPIRIDVDQKTQTATVVGTEQLPQSSKVSTGRCRYAVKLKDVLTKNDDLSFTKTTRGQRLLRASEVASKGAFRCSSVYHAGMPFSIPLMGGGEFIHGIDGDFQKSNNLGMPASAGCVRVDDNQACRIYATIKKCGSAHVRVHGQWDGDHVMAGGNKVPSIACDAPDDDPAKVADKKRALKIRYRKERLHLNATTPPLEFAQSPPASFRPLRKPASSSKKAASY